MSADDARDLEVDQMLFYAAVIEEQIEVLDIMTGDMFGVPGLTDGVAQIARNQIESAQAQLDRLIAEDTTWRPA